MGYGLRPGVRHAALALREDAGTPYGDDSRPDPAKARASENTKDPAPADPFAPFSWTNPDASDVDALEELGDSIALKAAYLHAGMYPYLVDLARFDGLDGWKIAGHRTCAHWLSFRTGHDLGTSREHVRVARALEHLPEIGAALARGALSFSQVRALTRAATPENESDLLELAENATVEILERRVRAYKKASRVEEEEEARRIYDERTFSVFPNDRGGYTPLGDLDPETGVVLMRAIDAANDHLYREKKPLPVPPEERQREAARSSSGTGAAASRAVVQVQLRSAPPKLALRVSAQSRGVPRRDVTRRVPVRSRRAPYRSLRVSHRTTTRPIPAKVIVPPLVTVAVATCSIKVHRPLHSVASTEIGPDQFNEVAL